MAGASVSQGEIVYDEMTVERPTMAWWHDLRDDVSVLQFNLYGSMVEAATTLVGVEHAPDGAELLCFEFFPGRTPSQRVDEEMDEGTVNLVVLAEAATITYVLRVVAQDESRLRVRARPLSATQRQLRGGTRTAYPLGPCPAVIHTVNGQWRGVIDLWLRDVSACGVGFKVELGRAYILSVGDLMRAPVTLPDGRRTWIDGTVTWLAPDGRGGIATRKPPIWLPSTPSHTVNA